MDIGPVKGCCIVVDAAGVLHYDGDNKYVAWRVAKRASTGGSAAVLQMAHDHAARVTRWRVAIRYVAGELALSERGYALRLARAAKAAGR